MAEPEARLRSLRETVRRRERELAILEDISARLHGEEDVQSILDTTLESVLEGLELATAWVFLEDEKDRRLRLVSHRGISPAYLDATRERGLGEPEIDEVLGISAMADRDYRGAELLFARAQPHAKAPGRLVAWRVLARCLAGDGEGAAFLAGAAEARPARSEPGWAEMLAACGLAAGGPPSPR